MAGTKQKSDKKDRSRKSPQNLRYKNERRHEKSHIRRMTKHLARYGQRDLMAVKMLREYKIKIGVSPG